MRKTLFTITFLVAMAAIVTLLVYIVERPGENPDKMPAQVSEGIMLYGCVPGSGWIENTNAYPVRIRRVWQYRGEMTQSIDRLGPGAKLSLNYLGSQHGFYIYTMDGVLVGWVSCGCPCPKK